MSASARSPSRPVAKAVLILASAAVLMWISIGVTLTMTTGETGPLALRWWPWGAIPKAAIANRIAVDPNATTSQLARAQRYAREALEREPVSVDAVRALGLIAARHDRLEAADGYFAYVEKLSRRDLTTQLWMIEKAVREDNILGALRHYDRALRTSRHAPDVLLPPLVAAADDPSVVVPLARLLVPRPNWWPLFLHRAVKDVKDARSLLVFGRSLKLKLSDEEDARLVRLILDRLVKDGYYADAYAYYLQLKQLPAAYAPMLRDGNFDEGASSLPFDWQLLDDPDLSAARELVDDDAHLALRASSGRGGQLARQLLVLKPGRYRISGRTGGTGIARLAQPSIEIACLSKTELLRQSLPPVSGEKVATFAHVFVVPATGCEAQWLSIATAPAVETDAWIDAMRVDSLGTGVGKR